MKRRWIIRSFFIGLLLLWVGGWVASYVELICATYQGTDNWALYSEHGVLYLHRSENTAYPKGFIVFHRAMLPRERSGPFLGFTWVDSGPKPWMFPFIQHSYGVPLWFPTTLSAAALWFAWRKTRPKMMRGAFPVEAAAADGGKILP